MTQHSFEMERNRCDEPAHRAAHARFTDDRGVCWCVREVLARGIPGARGDAFLLFEREGAFRRVWSYPANWASLAHGQLTLLSAAL